MTAFLDRLTAIVGQRGCVTDPQDLEPYLTDWRGAYTGRTPMVVRPGSADEVAEVVKVCAEEGVAIVPQGGNTGLCGGATPDTSGEQIIISLGRMNKVRDVDPANFSMEVEAGCVLEVAQGAAKAENRYLPLSLGAEGTCQVGGNISTNAGGLNVGRYGTARALVLGLEVVLADGTILSNLRSLRKDTAGYDLKQLFIGSEGTLGIITAATLRLFPDPGERSTALVGIESSGGAVGLLARLKEVVGDRIESFELLPRRIFELVARHVPEAALPFPIECPWYVLIEIAAGGGSEQLESVLMIEAEEERLLDAVIAKNASEAEALWRLRHSIAEAEKKEGRALKHDISVPLSRMEEFLTRSDDMLAELRPDHELVAFGHVGDGNLHYNIVLPDDLDDAQWAAEGQRLTGALYALVDEVGGSFAAEHGVGKAKKAWLESFRGGAELELMRKLKNTLDPANILNPGKVI